MSEESEKMGNSETRIHPQPKFPSRDLFDSGDDNGYILSGVQLNDDVLLMILSHVRPQDLVFNCRLVCKNWCNLIDSDVWKLQLLKSPLYRSDIKIRSLPWHLIYWVLKKRCLHRNFVKNPNGEKKLSFWKILDSQGNKWTTEEPPQGTDEPPPRSSCFATSYYPCTKEQLISLPREGAKMFFMDEVQPDINISEWYAGRFDCRAVYELKVNLLNESGDIIDEFYVKETCGGDLGCKWQQVKHTFRNYGAGVKFIKFFHGGVDNQFWAGHYGSKMTGAEVNLSLS